MVPRVALPLLILLAIVLSSSPTRAANASAKWTVMVYMSGDNGLEDYIVNDIELELGALGSNAEVQVVALADRGPGFDTRRGDWQTTKLFRVTGGMQATAANAVADWGERNMGDANTLVEFISWSKANYPAERYALVFWGHGWNWHPGWVMEDDSSGDTLDYHEIDAVLPLLGFNDVVVFDGCNMASIEIAQQWRGYASVLSASQEFVGWDGVEYDTVIAQLRGAPSASTDQVGIWFAQSAINERTWSTIALDGRFDTLVARLHDWSIALRAALASQRKAFTTAFGAARTFWAAPMDKDLYDLAYQMRNATTGPVRAASQAVMDAVAGVVLFERHTVPYASARGLTIYAPSKASQKLDHAYYRTIDLSLATGWDEFLDAWAR